MRFSSLMLMLVLALFSTVTFSQAIDINTASAEELAKGVQGLGPTKAAAIVKYREANGPFQSVNDLTKVTGIKEKALESLLADKRNQLTVGKTATPAMPAAPAMSTKPTAPAMSTKPTAPAMSTKPTAPVTEPPKQ